MIKKKKEYTFEVFESKVRDSKSVSSESANCEDIKVEIAALRELAAPNLKTQPLFITYPILDRPLKLNSRFLNLLSKFRGLHSEDPYRHINEFIITCLTMQPEGITHDQIRLRAFPFSLKDKAKDWLYYLPPATFTTWTQIHKAFLEKKFPHLELDPLEKKYVGLYK